MDRHGPLLRNVAHRQIDHLVDRFMRGENAVIARDLAGRAIRGDQRDDAGRGRSPASANRRLPGSSWNARWRSSRVCDGQTVHVIIRWPAFFEKCVSYHNYSYSGVLKD
jgi:hypothetical protein